MSWSWLRSASKHAELQNCNRRTNASKLTTGPGYGEVLLRSSNGCAIGLMKSLGVKYPLKMALVIWAAEAYWLSLTRFELMIGGDVEYRYASGRVGGIWKRQSKCVTACWRHLHEWGCQEGSLMQRTESSSPD
jgi:hypothetical protein